MLIGSYIRDILTDREIFMIGTAHVSGKSANEVRELIEVTPNGLPASFANSRPFPHRFGLLIPNNRGVERCGVMDDQTSCLCYLSRVISRFPTVKSRPRYKKNGGLKSGSQGSPLRPNRRPCVTWGGRGVKGC